MWDLVDNPDSIALIESFYEKAANWQSFAVTDGRLVTGQNPASILDVTSGRAQTLTGAAR